MVNKFITETKSRLIIDVVAPGFGADDIKVSKRVTDGGLTTTIAVSGKYVRPTGATDKVVPKFGYDKQIDKTFSLSVPIEGEDYVIEDVKYAVKNGIVRISVPKTAAAIGTVIAPLSDGDNVNVVDSVDSEDDDE